MIVQFDHNKKTVKQALVPQEECKRAGTRQQSHWEISDVGVQCNRTVACYRIPCLTYGMMLPTPWILSAKCTRILCRTQVTRFSWTRGSMDPTEVATGEVNIRRQRCESDPSNGTSGLRRGKGQKPLSEIVPSNDRLRNK